MQNTPAQRYAGVVEASGGKRKSEYRKALLDESRIFRDPSPSGQGKPFSGAEMAAFSRVPATRQKRQPLNEKVRPGTTTKRKNRMLAQSRGAVTPDCRCR
jgi:hypothetical protein